MQTRQIVDHISMLIFRTVIKQGFPRKELQLLKKLKVQGYKDVLVKISLPRTLVLNMEWKIWKPLGSRVDL